MLDIVWMFRNEQNGLTVFLTVMQLLLKIIIFFTFAMAVRQRGGQFGGLGLGGNDISGPTGKMIWLSDMMSISQLAQYGQCQEDLLPREGMQAIKLSVKRGLRLLGPSPRFPLPCQLLRPLLLPLSHNLHPTRMYNYHSVMLSHSDSP